eukprot:2702393-Pleurochrysis_carterae.AAC.1
MARRRRKARHHATQGKLQQQLLRCRQAQQPGVRRCVRSRSCVLVSLSPMPPAHLQSARVAKA